MHVKMYNQYKISELVCLSKGQVMIISGITHRGLLIELATKSDISNVDKIYYEIFYSVLSI